MEFPDGVNIIAESMYSQVDGDGHSFVSMSEITNHKKDGTAVSKDDGYEGTKDGQEHAR